MCIIRWIHWAIIANLVIARSPLLSGALTKCNAPYFCLGEGDYLGAISGQPRYRLSPSQPQIVNGIIRHLPRLVSLL